MLLGSFVEEFHEDKDDGDHDGLLTPVLPAIDSSSQSVTASSEFARQNIDHLLQFH
jgi:tRNA(Phe) wybutosine-synthesizing methylase Tyw3